MKYVDTHAHLSSEFFNSLEEAQAVYQAARAARVHTIINVATNMSSSRMVVRDQATMPHAHPAVGVHPLDITREEVNWHELAELAAHPKVVAIGEIGLDFHRPSAPRKSAQIRAFRRQLDIAVAVNKPVLIHIRDAHKEVLRELEKPEYKKLRGVIHTFSGTTKDVPRFCRLGFMLSYSGVVTFKNADQVRAAVKATPMSMILTETDSPFLTPHPLRGQRNEPKNVLFVAQELARVKNVPLAEMVNAIERNAEKLFNIH